jgi:hypothetical protein
MQIDGGGVAGVGEEQRRLTVGVYALQAPGGK